MTATPSDDYISASERDVPKTRRRFTADMDGETARSFKIPLDIKVMGGVNNTNEDLTFYVSFWDGSVDSLSNLHTAGTSSRIDSVAAGAAFEIAQQEEFNRIHFKAGSAATGLVHIRPGAGQENGQGTLEIAALEVVA